MFTSGRRLQNVFVFRTEQNSLANASKILLMLATVITTVTTIAFRQYMIQVMIVVLSMTMKICPLKV